MVSCSDNPKHQEYPKSPTPGDTLIRGEVYPLSYKTIKDSATQLVKQEGLFAGPHKLEIHKYYDRLGNVRIEKEFIHWDAQWVGYVRGIDRDVARLMEEDISYMNQIRYFDENGRFLKNRSTIYRVRKISENPSDSVSLVVDFQQPGYDIAYSKLHLILPDGSNKIRVIHRQGSSIDFKHHSDKLDGLGMVWMRRTDQESADSTYAVRVFQVDMSE